MPPENTVRLLSQVHTSSLRGVRSGRTHHLLKILKPFTAARTHPAELSTTSPTDPSPQQPAAHFWRRCGVARSRRTHRGQRCRLAAAVLDARALTPGNPRRAEPLVHVGTHGSAGEPNLIKFRTAKLRFASSLHHLTVLRALRFLGTVFRADPDRPTQVQTCAVLSESGSPKKKPRRRSSPGLRIATKCDYNVIPEIPWAPAPSRSRIRLRRSPRAARRTVGSRAAVPRTPQGTTAIDCSIGLCLGFSVRIARCNLR